MNVFRRPPYIVWLAFALLLWIGVGYRTYRQHQLLQPKSMAACISDDLQHRTVKAKAWLENREFVEKVFKGTITSDEAAKLADAPFYFYAFEDDILIFWNNNSVVSSCDINEGSGTKEGLFQNNGTFLRQCIHPSYLKPNQFIVVLFPIVYRYPFQNEYLHSHFAASGYIPLSTSVSTRKAGNALPVYDQNGKPLFYLNFKGSDIPGWMPDPLLYTGIVLALFLTFFWINLLLFHLVKIRRALWGLLLVTLLIVVFRGSVYLWGYPFHLGELPLFSPQLYASSKFFPSLGDLLLNVICGLWLTVYCYFIFIKERPLVPKRLLPAGLLIAILLLPACGLVPAWLIRSLVLDSGISFDVSHFYSINSFTVVGLFAIALIACCAALLIHLLAVQLRWSIPKTWLRFILLILASGLWLILQWDKPEPYEYFAVCWVLLFVLLQEIPALKKASNLFLPGLVIWAVFIAAFAALAVKYFYSIKERDNRRLFVERVVNQRDNVMEYLFGEIAKRIADDKYLRGYLDAPAKDTRSVIDERLASNYLRGPLNRYDSRIYLFNAAGESLFNPDTTAFKELRSAEKQGTPVNSFLFYRENARDAHYYLASIPVYDNTASLLGYVFIDMTQKKAANESVYPELLQPGKLKNNVLRGIYSYGIYVNKRLISQTNDYPFPVYLQSDSLRVGESKSVNTDEYVEVWYKLEGSKTVVLLHRHSNALENVTLFSYLLGVLVFLVLLSIILQALFRFTLYPLPRRLFQLTLRKRIHFAMLGVVILSFVLIGAVTVWFFISSYNRATREKLQSSMQVLERSVQQYLKDHQVTPDEVSFDAETEESSFKSFINNLSNSQGLDINIYNSYGALKTTSQDDIYNKSILARIMMPEAYYRLFLEGRTLWVQKEQIGSLRYLSCYVPLRDEQGETLGYINVPFFASEKELSFQISNVLVALINLYAFVLVLSSVLAVFITNWLTRTLHLIISKFERLNLQKNELLEWKHDDEIGLLVQEYNKMVMKVEANAARLAQSERESAWREMARQVAHEIKNPLTPMKLNIQYLQQALRKNHPDTRRLTLNVTASLIEQIDNLSHIASAFSDFARMPEAQPENVELNELVAHAVQLYKNNEKLTIKFYTAVENLSVYADRSQLLRIVTNLLQNAAQAIPEERHGKITVRITTENDMALVSISDNGVGIAEEVQQRIFEPYFTTKSSGTGLGLAMTKRIVNFWKGKIWFETTEGEGTTFFIQLPTTGAGTPQ